MKRFVESACAVSIVMLAVACGSHAPPRAAPAAGEAADSLEVYIGKVRRLSAAAPPKRAPGPTVETENDEVRTALHALGAGETAARHRRVAEAYRLAGILDLAYDHFSAASRLDSRDPAAYDGLARIWRDWGLPHLGLGDAQRALYYAPASASAHNTFATLLYALDQKAAARREFEQALALEPAAAYVWTNLCYASFQAGAFSAAGDQCRRALTLDPGSAAAHNNLGLVYTATGHPQLAAAEFAAVGDAATSQFNAGIALSAGQRYADAALAFDSAERLRPGWALAGERARQARRLSRAGGAR